MAGIGKEPENPFDRCVTMHPYIHRNRMYLRSVVGFPYVLHADMGQPFDSYLDMHFSSMLGKRIKVNVT